MNLREYFERLAEWEERPMVELVADWDERDMAAIRADFEAAFAAANFGNRPLEVPEDVSNQSVGNRVADHFVRTVNPHLAANLIEPCPGPGYPDKRLVRRVDGRAFVFELKATSHFNQNDSNRIVLTCSSRKLRAVFHPPVNHLLATVCYTKRGNQLTVEHLRLDFMEPESPVDVRLEGSVSQRALARGTQESVTF